MSIFVHASGFDLLPAAFMQPSNHLRLSFLYSHRVCQRQRINHFPFSIWSENWLNPSQPTFLVTIALAFGYLLFLSFLPSFLPFGLASRAEMSKATARYHGRIQLWIEVELRNKTVNKA
jgi:hypothetical protein